MKILKDIGWAISYPVAWIILAVRFLMIKSMAKRYRKDPITVDYEDRYQAVLKFAKLYLFIKNITINEVGKEKIEDKPMLFVANHKSNMDAIVLFKVLSEKPIPKPVFVAKQELAASKYADLFDLIDVLYIDRDNLRQMAEVANEQIDILKNKQSVVIFPEGTRVTGDEFGEFKPGALLAAYKTFSSIQPVVLYNTEGFIEKTDKDGNKYHNKTDRTIDINFMKLIQPIEFMNVDKNVFAKRLQKNMFDEYLKLRKDHHLSKQEKEKTKSTDK